MVVEVSLNKKDLYKAGKENGLMAETLDGFAMLASKLILEIDFNEENILIDGVKINK